MPVDTDRTLTELKKLREGRGLRVDRLAESPAVLSSVGTSDTVEGLQTLREITRRMGDSDRTRALRVDFGWDLEELLGRPATGRELDYLGDRRSAFADLVQRDVKTIGRWSNQAIEELRSQLITDQFDGNIIITAGVNGRRVTGVEVMRYEASDTDWKHGTNTAYTNPEDSSLPLVLFGYPRDWKPLSIRFVIAFMEGDYPEEVWALVADSVLDVGFGHERHALEIDDGMARCKIENPRRDQLYGVWWEWSR